MLVGDVIFATVRPTLLRAATVPAHLENQVCSTAFCVLAETGAEQPKDSSTTSYNGNSLCSNLAHLNQEQAIRQLQIECEGLNRCLCLP